VRRLKKYCRNDLESIYILGSTDPLFKWNTYIGMTANVERRLLQHNRLLPGGAKYTEKKGPWQFLCHVSGFPDRLSAYQAEWCMKDICKRNPQFKGPIGRVKALVEVLSTYDKWAVKYKGLISEERYTVTVQSKFECLLESLKHKPNLTIRLLDEDDFVEHFVPGV
jgi:predicted GIY-YIG superfamily endonuclease